MAPSPDSIIAWLSPLDFESKQSETLNKRAKDSSDWILHHPAFEMWLDGHSRSPVLWCHGLAGTGKTVGTAIVVNYLRHMVAGPRSAVVFIYCDEDVRPAQTALALLSSLCAQLAAQSATWLPPLVLKLYQDMTGPDGTRPLDIDNVMLVVMALCDDAFDHVVLCIDALDEVVLAGQRLVLLQKLRWLWNRGVQVFVTSQTHGDLPERCKCNKDIEVAMRDCEQLLFEADEEDIELSVWDRLHDQHDNGKKILFGAGLHPADVLEKVVGDCGGMFLMAQLKLDRELRAALPIANENRMRRLSNRSPSSSSSSPSSPSVRIYPDTTGLQLPMRTIELSDTAFNSSESSMYGTDDRTHPQRFLEVIQDLRAEDIEVASNSPGSDHNIWLNGLKAIAERQDPIRRECAMAALSWVLHVDEPLTTDDITTALGKRMAREETIRVGANDVGVWVHGLEQDLQWDDLARARREGGGEVAGSLQNLTSLIDICEGLIRIDNSKLVLSAPWNLGQATKAKMFPLVHVQIISSLLEAWCEYFNDDISTCITRKREDGVMERTTRRSGALMEYTVRNWSSHILACKEEFYDDDLVVEFLCKVHKFKPTWVERRNPLMREPYNVRVIDDEIPPLKAARLGLNRVLRILLEDCNYPIDAESYKRETAISVAVIAGHTSTVQLLLKHGASMHFKDELGDSLLHLAAQRDDEIMVALLLEMGLDKNTPARGRDAQTAIQQAISSKSYNATRMLLEYGCDASKDNALMVRAASSGNLELVKLLDDYGFDLKVTDYSNWASPLLFEAVKSGSEQLVEYMLQKGASVEQLNNRQRSVFHAAAGKGDINMVKLLFKYCNDPMVPYREDDGGNSENTTAVEDAMNSRGWNDELIELLLARMPSDVPSSVLLGMATGALSYGHGDVAKRLILMAPGPLQQRRKHIDNWLIGIAIRANDEEILGLVLSRGMSPTAKIGLHLAPLHLAATHNSPKAVALLMRYGADVNVQTAQGMSPLHMAAVSDSAKAAVLLMEHGANINALTVANMSPVHIAAHQGSTETLRVFLNYRPDLTIRAADGSTSLIAAGRTQRFDAARLLLEYEGDPSQSNLNGETILQYAAMDGQVDLVRALLDRGINISVCSQEGGTALHYAAYAGEAEIVRLLLKHGADVHQPYEFAGEGFQPPEEYSQRCVTWYQTGPALEDPHIRPVFKIEAKWTALHSAACAGYVDVVDILLAHGADISARGAKGESPLHVAASAAKPAIVEQLLEKGAKVDAIDSDGDTPLHWAARAETATAVKEAADSGKCLCKLHKEKQNAQPDHSMSDCVTALQKSGADPTIGNLAGMSPLAVAVAAGQVDLVEVLTAHMPSNMFTSTTYVKLLRTLEENPSVSALEKASEAFQETDDSRAAWCDLLANASIAGDVNMVKLAISKGAVPAVRTTKGENPLHQAILEQYVEIVNALLAAGADVEAADDQGRNALHQVARDLNDGMDLTVMHGSRKREQIATAILQQKGARVNGRTPAGDTALHFAVRTGDPAVVAALLKHSASVHIRNRQGRTPLHHAVDCYLFPQIIEMLLKLGANPTATDLQGYTPIHLMRDRKNVIQVLDLLLQHGADASVPTRSGDHPIHSAVRRNNWTVAKYLLDAGASVQDKGAHGRTLLHIAARRGHASLVEELLQISADVKALDVNGWTPMQHAKVKERAKVIDILSRSTQCRNH